MIDMNKYGLGNFVKVESMTSSRTGNAVANQVVVLFDNGEIFQSYDTIIAIRRGSDVWLNKDAWDYSRTTMKYLSQFLNGETKKEILVSLKDGFYHLEKF